MEMIGNNENPENLLRQTYKLDASARAVIDHFATLQGDVTSLGVTLLETTLKFPRQGIIEFFKKLHAWGFGQFTRGRRGHDSRFESRRGLSSIARIAMSTTSSNPTASEADEKTQRPSPESPGECAGFDDKGAPPQRLAHRFMLRPEYVVVINLPVDLSAVEAARLSDFVRALPFGRP
jgi:hypothetical protein